MTERHIFIADVHLRREEIAKRDHLLRFLSGLAGEGVNLYILGDLFNLWVGDRQLVSEPELIPVVDAIRDFVKAGGNLVFLHGNRDFIVSKSPG